MEPPITDRDHAAAHAALKRAVGRFTANRPEPGSLGALSMFCEEAVIEIAKARAEGETEMRKALELCDRYFMSCASAWAANEGKLMDKDRNPIAESAELIEMVEEAAKAVAAIVRPKIVRG